jgi:hypothetical protein
VQMAWLLSLASCFQGHHFVQNGFQTILISCMYNIYSPFVHTNLEISQCRNITQRLDWWLYWGRMVWEIIYPSGNYTKHLRRANSTHCWQSLLSWEPQNHWPRHTT